MDRVASDLAKLAYGRFAADKRSRGRFASARRQYAGGLANMDLAAATGDVSRTKLKARAVADDPPPLVIVDIGEQHLARHRDKRRIAVETVAVGEGELGALDLQVDEIGPGGVKPVKIKAFQQSELLQQHRSLAPEPCLANGEAAIIIGDRRLRVRRPRRDVVTREQAAMRHATGVHSFLAAAEAIYRLGNEA